MGEGGAIDERLRSRSARLLRARLRGDIGWLGRPARRSELERRFELVLQDTPSAGRQREVARRYWELRHVANEIGKGPSHWRDMRIDDRAKIDRALSRGSGLMIVSVHSPTMWTLASVLGTSLGQRVLVVAAEDQGPHQGLASVRASGSSFVRAGGAYEVLRQQLQSNGVVALAVDLPGPTDVTFMNKPAFVRSGYAGLAGLVGATVLPVLACWEDGLTLRTADAVEASPDMSAEAVCEKVFAGLDELLLPRPHYWEPFTSKLWPTVSTTYRWD